MIWTSEIPRLTGWYWCRSATRRGSSFVVCIGPRDGHSDGPLMMYQYGFGPRYVASVQGAEWAGPLQQPVTEDEFLGVQNRGYYSGDEIRRAVTGE